MLVPILSLAFAATSFAQTGAVVLLPLANTSKTPNYDWVGESIPESLREALENHDVLVREREETAEACKRLGIRDRALITLASAVKVGETLDAGYALLGSFQVDAGTKPTLLVVARLVGRAKGSPIVEMRESGPLDSLGSMEAHLSWRILSVVGNAPIEAEAPSLIAPVKFEAEEANARAVMESSLERQEAYLLRAVAIDAKYTHPAYRLGRIYYDHKEYKKAAEWLAKVDPRDSHFRMASFLLGLARFQAADYQGAAQAFGALAENVPLPEVLNNLAAAESRRGLPQAMADYRRAIEADPNEPAYRFNLGYAQWKAGDFNAAIESFRATVVRDPDDAVATLLLGRSLNRSGLGPADAKLRNLERLKENYDETVWRELKSLVEAPAR